MKCCVPIACLLLLLFTSCKAPQALEFKGIETIKVDNPRDGNLNGIVYFKLYNPNTYTLKLKKAQIRFNVKNQILGTVSKAQKQRIASGETVVVEVPVQLPLQNLLGSFMQSMGNGNVLEYNISGSVKAGRGLLYVKVPINYNGKEKIPF